MKPYKMGTEAQFKASALINELSEVIMNSPHPVLALFNPGALGTDLPFPLFDEAAFDVEEEDLSAGIPE